MLDRLKTWWGNSKTWHHVLLGIGLVFAVFIGIAGIVRIAHYDKILPGVSVRGIYIGSLTKQEALAKLNSATTSYLKTQVSYRINGKTIQSTPAELGVGFNNEEIINTAFNIGRENDIISDIATQTTLPFGDEDIMQLNVDKEKFTSALLEINNQVSKPSQNASYVYKSGLVEIEPSQAGEKLDLGVAIFGLTRQISNLNTDLQIPILSITPSRTTEALERQKLSVQQSVQNPVQLAYGNKSWTIDQQQLLSWLYLDIQDGPLRSDLLNRYYSIPAQLNDFEIEKSNIAGFLGGIAGEINQQAIDATLTINGGRASVFKQSRDGRALNIEKTTQSILDSINTGTAKPVELAVDITKAEVNNENIDNLGIKELIGEGVSYFPGSSAARLQNIRVGTSQFQGILVKPGQVFSFGEYLGEVGAAQGYAESKVILDGRQEFQYGGGLCQVSSTLFRAALNAGLPIIERVNHSFQVSYYTQPYGVPGVDATIYYPAVDMKFKNDTNKYILIQTAYSGTTLKFQLYGTKEKEGKIRGPFFNFGSLDPNAPSQTTFYRDVIVNGQVAKTDTFNTYYRSALDFPSSN